MTEEEHGEIKIFRTRVFAGDQCARCHHEFKDMEWCWMVACEVHGEELYCLECGRQGALRTNSDRSSV